MGDDQPDGAVEHQNQVSVDVTTERSKKDRTTTIASASKFEKDQDFAQIQKSMVKSALKKQRRAEKAEAYDFKEDFQMADDGDE
jgi:hypothetical protein